MGKKVNSKAKDRKAERKAMEKQMNASVANVKLANEMDDPISQLPSFTTYNKNGLNLKLETLRSPEVDQTTKDWAFKLLEDNMKPIYKETYGEGGIFEGEKWDPKVKREELENEMAYFLIARTEEGTPVAFSHFRFDMDYEDEVLYCYELQIEKKFRRKGLGKFMMKVLELLMIKANMLKIMVTIFKREKSNHALWKVCLKFETDETSPGDSVLDQVQYEIVSRYNLVKMREMLEEEASSENRLIN